MLPKTTKHKVAHLLGLEEGGAFLAAQGLSDKLCDLGYQSDIITPSWDKGSARHRQREQMNQVLKRYIEGQKYPELEIHTTFGGYLSFAELRSLVAEYDIVHLHWLHGFVSAEGVAYLTHFCAEQGKALLYTSHDMNLYSGACHYFDGCERWLENCNTCPQYLQQHWNDIPSKILAAKKKYWKLNALTIVSPSKYLAETVAKKSFLLQDWGYGCGRIEVVPNSVDTELFRPQNQSDARKRLRHLGLPQNGKLIAFLPSYVSSCKGLAEAKMVYDLLQQEKTGQAYYWAITSPAHSTFIGVGENVCQIPFLRERTECALLYAAADVVLVPSLEETFSLTTAEALACAKPVVGFHISGLADMIENGFNGYTVPLGNVCAMAEAVQKILEGKYLGDHCRHYAEQNLSRKTQVAAMDKLYRKVYQQAQAKQAVAQEQTESHKIPEIFPELTPRYLELYHEALEAWIKVKLHQTQQDRWYRFGHLSRKRKLWVMGKALSKKLKLYSLLRPVAKRIKPLLRKRQ